MCKDKANDVFALEDVAVLGGAEGLLDGDKAAGNLTSGCVRVAGRCSVSKRDVRSNDTWSKHKFGLALLHSGVLVALTLAAPQYDQDNKDDDE